MCGDSSQQVGFSRKLVSVTRAGSRVLCIDDDAAQLATMRAILEDTGHEVRTAATGVDGIEIARAWKPGCILLDYVMPGMGGEEVVRRVRAFDRRTQIVLVTGLAARPGLEMMQQLDIQGYHDKQDGPERLLIWIGAAMKAYAQVNLIELQSLRMRRILDATPLIHRLQPTPQLLATALEQNLRVLDGEGAGPAAAGAAVTMGEDGHLVLGATAGRFEAIADYEALPAEVRRLCEDTIASRRLTSDGARIGIPLTSASNEGLGVLAIERPHQPSPELAEIVQLLASQLALALDNIRLHEMASVDSLTHLHTRRDFMRRLCEGLRFAVREQRPLGLILIDVDRFKQLNDERGHLVGDRALAHIGVCIRTAVRETDGAFRYGGEEFVVLAPSTAVDGARILAERIRAAIAASPEPSSGARLTASIGFGALNPRPYAELHEQLARRTWLDLALVLLATVDAALYAAKRLGRDRCHPAGVNGSLDRALWDDPA